MSAKPKRSGYRQPQRRVLERKPMPVAPAARVMVSRSLPVAPPMRAAASTGLSDPPPDVDYSQLLVPVSGDGQPFAGRPGLASLIGLLLAVSAYVVGMQLVVLLVLGIGYGLRHPGVNFTRYVSDAEAFNYPEGMLAAHLGLAWLIGLSILLVRFLHKRRPGWLSSVRRGLRWHFLGVCVGVALVVLNLVMWLPHLGKHVSFERPANVWVWLAIIVLTSPLQAAGEEYFFRGYLLQGLGAMARGKRAQWVAVVGSAVVFALFHGVQNAPLFLDRLAFGLLAGWLAVATGGLEAGIAAHVVNNLLAFGYALFMGGVAEARGITTITWSAAALDIGGFAAVAAGCWGVARARDLPKRTPASLQRSL